MVVSEEPTREGNTTITTAIPTQKGESHTEQTVAHKKEREGKNAYIHP
jgi:hypothetical protein